MNQIFTTEAVSAGHPDKVADYISDSILDACLTQDPMSRVACETLVTSNTIILAGEITTKADINYERVAKKAIEEIGYHECLDDSVNFKCTNVNVTNLIHTQSPNIAQGVDTGGAGDQGFVFGYACNQHESLLPLQYVLTQQLMYEVDNSDYNYLPDGKCQLTMVYENGVPKYISHINISKQHTERLSDCLDIKKEEIYRHIIKPLLGNWIDDNTKFTFNNTGLFLIGGPDGDTGLTGRKIIVDTYGGFAHHGGGAFSGKDATKVDRTGAYMAREIAKHFVNNGMDKCEVQIGYVIGDSKPVSVSCNGNEVSFDYLYSNNLPIDVNSMIAFLDLRKPNFTKRTNYGHFLDNKYLTNWR